MKAACSRDAARESAGTPWRYLPVSTPRPSGDQGSRPSPSAVAAPATSSSASRLSSEYSTSLATSGTRPADISVAAWADCQPE